MAELKAEARRQLAAEGAAALSVRAVARQLGMVSSAVYRYVRSRDELLTLLIIDAYDAVGEVAEQALHTARRRSPAARWAAVGRAIRDWAIANPHEYALIYGSPVPGYAAPVDTIAPATRPTQVLVAIVADAQSAGSVTSHDVRPVDDRDLPAGLRSDLTAIATELGADLPPSLLARTAIAWSQMFGLISFELFGQTRNAIHHHEQLFDVAMASMTAYIGLHA
jgi:AcrR family transcriptional regulator